MGQIGLKVIDFEAMGKSELIDLVSSFRLDDGLRMTIERRGEVHWCVSNGTSVLNTDLELEWEPRPSGRSDDFIARTRMSLNDAFALWNRYASQQNELKARLRPSASGEQQA